MRSTLFLLVLLLTVVSCASDSDDNPTEEECARLGEHVIELRLIAAGGDHLPATEREKHREALRAASRGDAKACQSKRTEREVACILASNDLDSLNACTSKRSAEDDR